MKNMKKILVASLLSLSFVFSSFESMASENLEVVIMENSQMMRMEVNNPSSKQINVYLFDENEREIYSEKVEPWKTTESQFDFAGFKNGTYTLTSEVSNLKLTRVLEVSENDVKLVESFYSFIPVFEKKDDKLIVHYINNGAEDIGISIENERGPYYDAYFGNGDIVFTKSFSLENLEAGTYKFQLISKGNFYSHEFKVD